MRAVLFAKDLNRVAEFYCRALGMVRGVGDDSHSVLRHRGFELIVHQIPKHIADGIEIAQPPLRRDGGSLRLDYPVESLEESRRRARSLGGDIELDPPEWADRDVNFYLGHDPEGNRFGVSQQATSDASH